MSKQRTGRRYVRYPECFAGPDARGHGEIVRAAGAQVIELWKADFCCWYTVQVWATPEQMTSIEAAWKAAGVVLPPRRPRGAWAANVTKPRPQWVDRVAPVHLSA